MTKKKKIIMSVAILVLVLALVLFIPYSSMEYCVAEQVCSMKKTEEYLGGRPVYNHDCDLCVNGIQKCTRCGGTGKRRVTKSNFERLLDAI